MIVTDCNITVSDNKSLADKNIVVYRGDYNIQVTFSITQSNGFKYLTTSSSNNLIESTNASFAQMIVKLQDSDEVVILTEIEPTKNGKVTLTIIKEYIDELVEVGAYDYQIRLFSTEQHARLTIPPVSGQLIVKEPIMFLDDSATINLASVGTATVADDEDDMPAFDSEGNYNKTDWSYGDIITESKLNKIEDAIFHTLLLVNNKEGDINNEVKVFGNDEEPYIIPALDGMQFFYSEFTEEDFENGARKTFYFKNVLLSYLDPISQPPKTWALKDELVLCYVGKVEVGPIITDYYGVVDQWGTDIRFRRDTGCLARHVDYNLVQNYQLASYALKTDIPSTDGLATEQYVDDAVANVDVDLTGYATEAYVQDAIDAIELPEGGGNVDLTGYATEQFVNDAISNMPKEIPTVSGVIRRMTQLQSNFATEGFYYLSGVSIPHVDPIMGTSMGTIYLEDGLYYGRIGIEPTHGGTRVSLYSYTTHGSYDIDEYVNSRYPAQSGLSCMEHPSDFATQSDLSSYATQSELSAYATKEELPPIRIIGSDNADEPYILTGNEFTDEEYEACAYSTVFFKNVIFKYTDPNWSDPNYEHEFRAENEATVVGVWYEDNEDKTIRWIDILTPWGNEYMFIINPDGSFTLDYKDSFAWDSNLENYATKNDIPDIRVVRSLFTLEESFSSGIVYLDDIQNKDLVYMSVINESYNTKLYTCQSLSGDRYAYRITDNKDGTSTGSDKINLGGFATKEELQAALGNIEDLLGGI